MLPSPIDQKEKEKKRNTINLLVNHNGHELLEDEEIKDWISNYFQDIYSPPLSQINIKNPKDILSIFHPIVDDHMNNDLTRRVIEEEVMKIVFNMN